MKLTATQQHRLDLIAWQMDNRAKCTYAVRRRRLQTHPEDETNRRLLEAQIAECPGFYAYLDGLFFAPSPPLPLARAAPEAD